MASDAYKFPVAVSRIEMPDSREAQNIRAIRWLRAQSGGPIVVVTPQARFEGESVKRLVEMSGVTHLTWRGLSTGSFWGNRVLHAWPDKKHLDGLWGVEVSALAVIEWGVPETAQWIEDANPIQLLPGKIVGPAAAAAAPPLTSLPNGVEEILEYVAAMAAGYDTGLKWNEEDKVKADMMNRPERWATITVEQVRAKCRALKMRPEDMETIVGFLARRKAGRRFNVKSSYRSFSFR